MSADREGERAGNVFLILTDWVGGERKECLRLSYHSDGALLMHIS